MTQHLLDELAHFTGPNWEQEDDITMVLLEHTAAVVAEPLVLQLGESASPAAVRLRSGRADMTPTADDREGDGPANAPARETGMDLEGGR